MIAREILANLVPGKVPDIALPPPVAALVSEDRVLRNLALWSALVQQDLDRLLRGEGESALRPMLVDSDLIGVGIFHASDAIPANDDFPVIAGFRFGLSIYHPRNLINRDGIVGPRRSSMRLSFNDIELPVVSVASDFILHNHPKDGRCSALLDIRGSSYLLTARHVVEHLRIGNSVDLRCNHGATKKSTLITKAPGCIDAALLAPLDPYRLCETQSAPSAVPAVQGLTVNSHFASSPTPQSATIMQALRSGQILSAVQPHMFLMSIPGLPGDSGAAVSSTQNKNEVMVGMYLGETDVEDQGVRKTMGYALETLQTLWIFKANLLGGILR